MSLGLLYLLFVVFPAIKGFGFLAAISFLAGLIGLLLYLFVKTCSVVDDCKKSETFCSMFKPFVVWALCGGLVVGFITDLIPDNEQLLIISGAYVATNSEELAKLPDNMLEVANSYLEKLKEEVSKEVVETTKEVTKGTK